MTETRPAPKLSLRQDAALLAVQMLLQSGKLAHRRDGDQEYALHGTCFFNMNFWKDEQEIYDENDLPIHCGTMMCIGGTTDWVLGERLYQDETRISDLTDTDTGLYELFYPGQSPLAQGVTKSTNWDRITPQQAAKAIANYRASGDPKWHEVLDV